MDYLVLLNKNTDLTFKQSFIDVINDDFKTVRNSRNITVNSADNSYSINSRFSLSHAFFDLSQKNMNQRVLPDFDIQSDLIISSLEYFYQTVKKAYLNYCVMSKKSFITSIKGSLQIKFDLTTHEYQGTSIKILLCLKHNKNETFFNIVYDFDNESHHRFEIQKDLNTYKNTDQISNYLFFILSIPRITDVISDLSVDYTMEEIKQFQKVLEMMEY